ncbi:hypothetical protein Tco_0327435 [Tanacetum coccineum]
MKLRLQKGSIKATRQKVHEMLGILMRSKKLEDLELRPSNDPFITEPFSYALATDTQKLEHSNDEKEGCARNDKEMLEKAGTS